MKKTNQSIKVVNVTPKGGTATRIYSQEISEFNRLGREIRISPKSNITVNKKGFKVEFFTETVNVLIGIGKHWAADVIMTKDAWEALLSGEKISIETTEQFKRKYIYPKKKKHGDGTIFPRKNKN